MSAAPAPAPAPAPAVEPPGFRTAFARYLRLWAWATASGLLVGVLVIGVGGRLAMRLIALTSSDAVQGAFTDAGEEIGEISLDGTLGLVIFGTLFFGGPAGWLYGAVRPVLPTGRRRRVLVCGLAGAALGTPLLLDPGGRDFSILNPLWLAVVLFILVAALFGMLIPIVAERLRGFYESMPRRFPHLLALLPLLPYILIGPAVVVGLVVGVVYAWLTARGMPGWLAPVGRVALAAALVWGAAVGTAEVLDIEGRAPLPSDFVEPDHD